MRLKLIVQPESSLRDVEASMYRTVLLPTESEIVKEMKHAGRLDSDIVRKNARSGKRNSAQRDAKSHQADPHGQVGT